MMGLDMPSPATTPGASTADFAAAARRLSLVARRHRLEAPSYRSPPRLVGVDRTIRRRPEGGAVVAVRVHGRPVAAVLADMIEGVIVANALVSPQSDRARTELWRALEHLHDAPVSEVGSVPRISPTEPPEFRQAG
ncbi:MAG: hypothetical protein AAGA42_02835 [Actinomycetota bacterium]